MENFRHITLEAPAHPFIFSICCIVTGFDEYELMKSSFQVAGFTKSCEWLVADNTAGNRFNAYEAIRIFLRDSQGTYVIIVHQDVRCVDSFSDLQNQLEGLSAMDKNWGVCGNAGANGYHRYLFHLNNNGRVMKSAGLPAPATALDENILIVRNDTGITVSSDLQGFHLYGTDLCIIAKLLGYTCYVIPFMVDHLSIGRLPYLDSSVREFTRAYGHKFQAGYIQTTATKFYLGRSPVQNRIYNHPAIFFLVKTLKRLRYGLWRLANPQANRRSVTKK